MTRDGGDCGDSRRHVAYPIQGDNGESDRQRFLSARATSSPVQISGRPAGIALTGLTDAWLTELFQSRCHRTGVFSGGCGWLRPRRIGPGQ